MSARLKCIQVNFFERLLKNRYTQGIVKELLTLEQEDDYIKCILDILAEIECDPNYDILKKCNYYKYTLEMEHKANKKDNIVLKELYLIFNERNGDSKCLFNLLRYDKYIDESDYF